MSLNLALQLLVAELQEMEQFSLKSSEKWKQILKIQRSCKILSLVLHNAAVGLLDLDQLSLVTSWWSQYKLEEAV